MNDIERDYRRATHARVRSRDRIERRYRSGNAALWLEALRLHRRLLKRAHDAWFAFEATK